MLTHAAWVNLRKGKIGISLGNERNHLGKEQDSQSIEFQTTCSIGPSNLSIVGIVTPNQHFLWISSSQIIILIGHFLKMWAIWGVYWAIILYHSNQAQSIMSPTNTLYPESCSLPNTKHSRLTELSKILMRELTHVVVKKMWLSFYTYVT